MADSIKIKQVEISDQEKSRIQVQDQESERSDKDIFSKKISPVPVMNTTNDGESPMDDIQLTVNSVEEPVSA